MVTQSSLSAATVTTPNMDSSDNKKSEHNDPSIQKMREQGQKALEELHRETKENSTSSSSFSYQHEFFHQHGFYLLSKFSDEEKEVLPMKEQMLQWTNESWDEEHLLSVFRTDQDQVKAQGSNDYFLDSANNVHYFAEKDAIDENSGFLKPEFRSNKIEALNKVGHALHIPPNQPFHTYTTSPKITNLVRDLGWTNPIVPQSMYIFKQARVGGEVTSHQDSTFLYTTPRQTCLGLWLALDDATLENGCLWVRPGSHREGLRRRFIRNPEHFGDVSRGIVGDASKPQMMFIDESEEEENTTINTISVPWEGKLPENSWPPPSQGLFDAGFIPVECKAGDLIVFPGRLDHLSLPNYSDSQRHTFQLHLVEGPMAGVTWADTNWLQYPNDQPFLAI